MMPSAFHLLFFLGKISIFIAAAQGERCLTTGYLSHLQARQTDSSANHATSTSSPASATVTACSIDCSVCAQSPYSVFWTPYTINGTITAATVVKIVNTLDDTTRTTTLSNDLPSGYSSPPTNADGTHVQSITYTRSGADVTTGLAFPTAFIGWPDGYSWNGTLQTQQSCVTAVNSSFVPFPSFSEPVATTPTRTDGISDPNGLLWTLVSTVMAGFYYSTVYEDQGALQSCTACQATFTGPAIQAFTMSFLTATSTSYESAGASTTPSDNNAGPSKPPTTTSSSSSPAAPPAPGSSLQFTQPGSYTPAQPTETFGQTPSITTGPSVQPATVETSSFSVFTTVIPGPSGSATITAISAGPGMSLTGTATNGIYMTVVTGPSGPTTITAVRSAGNTSLTPTPTSKSQGMSRSGDQNVSAMLVLLLLSVVVLGTL